ncbi:hypothetical protein [Paracoccus aestuariivivens]|uniref:Uncharacterized protein n=1 Tax=Paracoccus aestuariivivens TaxID=1820333 RepID=A0A6L6J9H2_9RHOB|nr:hypothetical protein [Paracoccus aestuariivivens]MTH77795.1 hypothetical protein [Paracoccus aestuariivivens]
MKDTIEARSATPTEPAALKTLNNAALNSLVKELRAKKTQATDAGTKKVLSQELRLAVDEKMSRLATKPTKKNKTAKANGDAGNVALKDKPAKAEKTSQIDKIEEKRRKLAAQTEKLEEKRRKLEEKAEKQRVRNGAKVVRKVKSGTD